MSTTPAYRAEYDRQARAWNVVDAEGNLVGMFGGGKRGREQAERSAANLAKWEARS
jgi:hypothetical protein